MPFTTLVNQITSPRVPKPMSAPSVRHTTAQPKTAPKVTKALKTKPLPPIEQVGASLIDAKHSGTGWLKQQTIDAIFYLRNKGYARRKIANFLGVSESVVKYRIINNLRATGLVSVISDGNKVLAKRMYSNGKSVYAISSKLGENYNTVRAFLARCDKDRVDQLNEALSELVSGVDALFTNQGLPCPFHESLEKARAVLNKEQS